MPMVQENDPEIVRLRREARDLLVAALRALGYSDAQSVHRAMSDRQRRGESIFVVPARTIGRYISEGPPLAPKNLTRDSLNSLGELAGIRKELQEICQQLWTRCQRNEQEDALHESADDRQSLPPKWYQVIPAQNNRPYPSIDIVLIEKQSSDAFEGAMVRVSPPGEQGYHWRFKGTRFGVTALYAIFYPKEIDNLISRGTIALRATGYRLFKYEGLYTRLSEHDLSLITRRIIWQRSMPQTALHNVALIDLDNTLRPGWSIRPWLAFLARDGMREAAECLRSIDDHFHQYAAGAITHDDLATTCATDYARIWFGKPAGDLEDMAEMFVRNHDVHALYDFVAPLIESLKQRGIAPIILSGAPRELVKSYSEQLGVEEYYGMALAVDKDGAYNGTVESNTGVADTKRTIVRQIRSAGREAVIAIGDSSSDIPMWDAARNKIIVGSRPREPEWSPERTLTIVPGETSWQSIHEWLSANLESVEIPALDDSEG